LPTTGIRIAAKTPITAITESNSIRVNADRLIVMDNIRLRIDII